jgi:unspecific monooxygenase
VTAVTAPEIPARDLSGFDLLAALRDNALRMWPQEAYDRDMLQQPFFGRRRVLINTPDAIHRVLVDNTANYRRSVASIRILRPLVGRGLLLAEGDAWRHQRRTTSPAFTPRIIPVLAGHVATATAAAIARLPTDAPVDLLAAMQTLALDIAGQSMFSLAMQGHGAALRRLLGEFQGRLNRPTLLDLTLPLRIPSPRDLARRRFHRRWAALIDAILHTRLSEPPRDPALPPRDVLDLLIAARDPETGAAFPPDQLRDQAATLIVAGHETTGVALFWTLYLLAAAPDQQAHIAQEVAGLDLSADHAATSLAHLPFTRAVVSEALRLYPPAFTMVRQAIGPDQLDGTPIATNTLVMIAPWVLHRHRRLWQNPDSFDPTRFLPDAPPPPRFAYMPFGAGPRICIGAQFALTELTLVTATLLQHFSLSLATPRRAIPTGRVTTQPDHPAPFTLRRRKQG